VAATYAVLKILGRPLALDELEGRFRNLRPGVDLGQLSLADLREVIEGLGLHARALRVKPEQVDRVPQPAILYLPAEHLGRGKRLGHFVVLCSIKGREAEILELTVPRGRVLVPLEKLEQVWDGRLLAVSGGPLGAWWASRWTLVGLLLALAAASGVSYGKFVRSVGR
jgi:ABC-type bacteriocin/lantibiotic exporter with double-glycine peptidase domain